MIYRLVVFCWMVVVTGPPALVGWTLGAMLGAVRDGFYKGLDVFETPTRRSRSVSCFKIEFTRGDR